jgi:hypothetical protein
VKWSSFRTFTLRQKRLKSLIFHWIQRSIFSNLTSVTKVTWRISAKHHKHSTKSSHDWSDGQTKVKTPVRRKRFSVRMTILPCTTCWVIDWVTLLKRLRLHSASRSIQVCDAITTESGRPREIGLLTHCFSNTYNMMHLTQLCYTMVSVCAYTPQEGLLRVTRKSCS